MKELIIVSVLLGIVLGFILRFMDKKTKTRNEKEKLDFAEFERARADNPLIKQLHIDRAKQERTRHEMDEVRRIGEHCQTLIMRYSKEIPDEDFRFFMLHEGWSAFLPISIKEHLGPFDGLIIIHNPYKQAKLNYERTS